jgi:hypothetical protein
VIFTNYSGPERPVGCGVWEFFLHSFLGC